MTDRVRFAERRPDPLFFEANCLLWTPRPVVQNLKYEKIHPSMVQGHLDCQKTVFYGRHHGLAHRDRVRRPYLLH